MPVAKAKRIDLLLYDGTLSGVICIKDSGWDTGELYSAPRESVMDLINTDACKKSGVYLLLSQDKVYVGQSIDLSKRITQHLSGKDWWESVVILTKKDDSLDHADIDYLESVLIEKANEIGHLDCDNKVKGNNANIDYFDKVILDQYLEEALFLMELIGITVFAEKSIHVKKHVVVNAVDDITKLLVGTRAKSSAVKLLKENGIELGDNITYAKISENGEYWANPNKSILSSDWHIILNDNSRALLTVMKVPEKTFSYGTEDGQIKLRSDKQELLDIWIDSVSFVEKKSGCDFSDYVTAELKYK